MIQRWRYSKSSILSQKEGQRKTSCGRCPAIFDVEARIYAKFSPLRKRGIQIKRSWFISQAKIIYEELYGRKSHKIHRLSIYQKI